MNNYTKFLIPIPIFVLFALFFFKIATSEIPFWYKGLSDPSYLYLESTLHIALGKFPIHVDNPGAPIQDIGALTFRITHLLNGEGDFAEDVLNRSEYYLKVLRYVLAFIACVSIWFAGFFAFQISKNYFITILVQLSPVFSNSVLGNIHRFQTISPEIFFIPLGLLWLIFFLRFLETEDDNPLKTTVGFSAMVGLMIATKLTLLPYCIMPLFWIKNTQNKALYVILSVIFFLFFAFFQFFSSEKLFLWIRDLFFASGAYGTGNRNFIDISQFLENLVLLFSNEPILAISLLVNGILIVLNWFKNFGEAKPMLALKSLFFAELVYVIMTAKHYIHEYYIYGVVFMISANMILWFHLIQKEKLKKWAFVVVTGFASLLLPYHLIATYRTNTVAQKKEIEQVKNFYLKHNNTFVITEYEAISQPYAFSFGIASFAPELRNPFGYFLQKNIQMIFILIMALTHIGAKS